MSPARSISCRRAAVTPTPGNLTLRNLELNGGLARGGNAGAGGGGGAGMGGAIFNQGTLLLDGVTATANTAQGGMGETTADRRWRRRARR